MTLPISAKQMEVLKAFKAFAETHGRTPSVRELARLLGRAPSTIHQFLRGLEERGLLKNDHFAHGWHVPDEGEADETSAPEPPSVQMTIVPIQGRIAAGCPIEAVADASTSLTLPREMVGDDAYALEVEGESMIEDHILDGDIVLLQPQSTVNDGEIAVALLDDESATLKRVYREPKRKRIRLQPANADMEPFFVEPERLRIQGKVIGVYRPLR